MHQQSRQQEEHQVHPGGSAPAAHPSVPRGHPVLALQRSIGNQAVQRLLQRKLTVGAPDDEYEREAEQVSERVMRMPDPSAPEVAEVPAGSVLQRVPSAPSGAGEAPPEVDKVLRAPGESLDPGTRAFMEPRFGHDFGQVRVHTGPGAEEAARSVQARAFTVGSHVVFGAGEFSPGTDSGRRLISHELTHVVQQGGGSGVHAAPAMLSRRELGHYREQIGMISDIDVVVRTRSVAEWRTFLRDEASSEDGGDELMAFMALALGRRVKTRPTFGSSGGSSVDRPTEAEALDLMEALLTTGSGVDFDEDNIGVFGISDFPGYGNRLLGDFSRTFAARVLSRMTTRGPNAPDRLGGAYSRQVQEYVREADGSWGSSAAGPGLINGALGAAIAAATKFMEIGSDTHLARTANGAPVLSEAEVRELKTKKNEMEVLVHNAAATVAGVIGAEKAIAAQQQAIRDAIISSAFSILPALLNFRSAELARLATGGGTTGNPSAAEPERYRIALGLAAGNAVRSAAGSVSGKLVSAAAASGSGARAREVIEGFTNALDDVRREMTAGPAVYALDTNALPVLVSTFSGPLTQLI